MLLLQEISLAESSNDGSQLVQMMPVIKVTPDTSLDSSDTFSFGSTDINQSTCDIFFETSSIMGGPPMRKPSVEMETPLTHSRLKCKNSCMLTQFTKCVNSVF